MKRWMVLSASVIMQSCLGAVYAWSTFVPALSQEYGIHSGRTGLIFGVCIASFTVSMVFGGSLQRKYGPRRIGAAGGLLFLTGYLIGSFSAGNFLVLLAGFGVIAGAGIGFGYVCPLATSVRWFPRHKGLITGLTVAGFGLGSVFFSKAALIWLEKGIPVLHVLRGLGLLVGTIVVLASCFLSRPSFTHQVLPEKNTEFPLRKILRLKEFKSLFFMIFCGTFGGLLVIGNLKPIGLSLALSATQATFAVMLFAAGNAAGRILWGLIYDRFGFCTIPWCMLLLSAGAGTMGLFKSLPGFYLSTLLIAFAFGGCFVLFASRVADTFGIHRLGEIYPFVFLGYGIAGLIGPASGGLLLNYSGTPSLASAVVVAVALIGAITAKLHCVREIN